VLRIRYLNSKGQIATAAIVGVSIDQLLGAIVDIGKVWYGVEELEAVPGLPESIVIIEAVDFVTNTFISGVLFGVIPAFYLIPKLYGKIEPLMGMNPRDKNTNGSILELDRKSTRLNSSHVSISYAVFCLKKKTKII